MNSTSTPKAGSLVLITAFHPNSAFKSPEDDFLLDVVWELTEYFEFGIACKPLTEKLACETYNFYMPTIELLFW
jgi:hypothetical protein